ncbi:MAG: hypothetical protein NT030_00900 [Candidatus Saganbacteria bacterium]|nr:hypothetical protein [Candidatus Saganbacteria bacterium]
MFNKIFSQPSNEKTNKTTLPREVHVRIVSVDRNQRIPKSRHEIPEEELIKEDEPKLKSVMNGIVIGSSIGLLICLISYLFGLPTTAADTIVLVGLPVVLSGITGYALF